jgi:hypothetical protein
MKIAKIVPLVFVTIVSVLIACSKEGANKKTETASLNASQTSNLALNTCDQLAYADTIFYLKPQKSNYIIKPLASVAGTYGAFPAGLHINAVNGNINVNLSETGLEYIVWFVPSGTTDTCKKLITISGVNYKDTVYVMATNPKASPIYNANTSIPIVSKGSEFDDGPDDDNGNGSGDEPPGGHELIPQGFVIDKSTGVIDFKASIRNGVLGKNPISGTKKEFTLYYRLGDKSKNALNHISFELFYYKNQSDIPPKVMEDLLTKQGQVLLENEDDDGGHGGGHGGGGNHGPHFTGVNLAATSEITAKNGNGETKCRPPYIIVTQK